MKLAVLVAGAGQFGNWVGMSCTATTQDSTAGPGQSRPQCGPAQWVGRCGGYCHDRRTLPNLPLMCFHYVAVGIGKQTISVLTIAIYTAMQMLLAFPTIVPAQPEFGRRRSP